MNIGLSGETRERMIESLNQALANEFVLYTKLRKYHWNVKGANFVALHTLYEQQYTALELVIDEAAERAVALGGVALGTFAEFSQNAILVEKVGHNPDAAGMSRELAEDHETLAAKFRADFRAATEAGDDNSADFFINLVQQHEKMAWMLRALLA